MKSLYILPAVFCAVTLAAFAQTSFDPSSLIGQAGSRSVMKPGTSTPFTFVEYSGQFIRGWNWSAPNALLDSAMHMNMHHGIADYTRYGRIQDSISTVYSADYKNHMFVVEPFLDVVDVQDTTYADRIALGMEVAGSEWTNAIMNAQALHLEPTLEIDRSELGVTEQEGTIYGFNLKKGTTILDSGVYYRRFIPSEYSAADPIVLCQAWRTDILRFENCVRVNDFFNTVPWNNKQFPGCSGSWSQTDPKYKENYRTDREFFHDFNGKRFYLSINLRTVASMLPRLSSLKDSDTVLALKLPMRVVHWIDKGSSYAERDRYERRYTEKVYAMFDSLPQQSLGPADTIQIRSSEPLIASRIRGIANRSLNRVSLRDTAFVITAGMLRQAEITQMPITLSASMSFMGGNGASKNGLPVNTFPFDNTRLLPRDFSYRKGLETGKTEGSRQIVGLPPGTAFIDSLDIEVEYFGKIAVDINWIRLETPRARKLFRGFFDHYLRNNLQRVIELVYDRSPKTSWVLDAQGPSGNGSTPPDWKLCGVYGMDETGPLHYSSMRYVNKLLGGCLKQEQFSRPVRYYRINRDIEENSASHLATMTGMQEFWNGSNIFVGGEQMSPLVRWGNMSEDKVRLLGFHGGYAGFITDKYGYHYSDSLRSGYEADFLSNDYRIAPNTDSGKSLLTVNQDPYLTEWPCSCVVMQSVQSRVERDLHDCYYLQPGLLFGKKAWWANVWIDPGILKFPVGNDSTLLNRIRTFGHTDRFRTAEEVRAQIWLPVLFGAKGLIYWFKASQRLPYTADTNTATEAQLGCTTYDFNRGSSPSLWQQKYVSVRSSRQPGDYLGWLRSDTLGGDYLDLFERDANPSIGANLTLLYDTDGYDWATLGWEFNRGASPLDRIYTGMKNTRIEIEKLHRMIMDNESYIMGLKFMACYGKGFIKMYAQDPSSGSAFDGYKDTILKKYLDIGATLTRPLVRISQEGAAVAEYEQNHGLDSGFYDITLFTNPAVTITDTSINRTHEDSSIVIGVMNRRTDPLFRYVRTQATAAGHEGDTYNLGQMTYLTTAEWDSLKSTGGAHWKVPNDSRTKEWWQARYNERLGGREITLKFLYKSTATSDPDSKGKLLRVREIVASGVRGLDTIVSSTSYLAINFEPGEGKLLEVTMRVPENSVSEGTGANDGVGSLLNTGQRKIVAVPRFLRIENGAPVYDSNQIRYHLVYHRKAGEATNGAELRDVYYKRSRYVQRSFSGIGASSNLVNGLEWEPEVLVSQYLMPHNIPNTSPHNDKAFPSIVVRFDNESQTMKAFIVFAAQSTVNAGGSQTTGGIYETSFDADAFVITPQPAAFIDSLSRSAFSEDWGNLISSYGHPVINAHADGQYICYSDGRRGIVARWQRRNWPQNAVMAPPLSMVAMPAYRFLTGPEYLFYNLFVALLNLSGPGAIHPSINSYSVITRDDRTALLVWEESLKRQIGDSSQIMAAHLSHDVNGQVEMLPVDPTKFCWTNADNTIACVSECTTSENVSPCVFENRRSGDEYELASMVGLPSGMGMSDMYTVVWKKAHELLSRRLYVPGSTSNNTPIVPLKSLATNYVYNMATLYNGKPYVIQDYSVSGTYRDKNKRNTWGNAKPFDEKAFPLDILVAKDETINAPLILLQPHMEWSEDFSVRGVSQPRLAEYMLIDQPAQSNIARRVYRKPDASQYSAITASAAHLMKSPAASDGLDNVQLYGYGTRSQRMCMEIRDQTDRPLQLGMLAESEVDGDSLAANSLVTNWFTVGAEYPFHLLYNGTGTDFMSLSIQRRGDSRAYSAEYQCTEEPSESNEVRTVSGRLLNGNNAEYRFIVKPKRKELEPTYSFFVQHNDYDDARDEELPKVLADLSTLNAISAEQIYIVAYPNPASSRVDVSIQSPGASVKQGATLTVVNILGETMYKGSVGTGGVTTLETDLWPEGMYSVRCEFRTGLTECKTAARDFIIRR